MLATLGQFESIWGLSLTETLLVLALILVIVDLFLATDFPTYLAYVLVSIVCARQIEAHLLYRILLGLVCWFALIAFHYFIWKRVLQHLVNRVIAPDRIKFGGDGLIDGEGKIRDIDGNLMVEIRGDVWPFACEKNVSDGDRVKIMGRKGGLLIVHPKKPSKE